MFQVCHLWHIVEKPRVFQFEQQIVLRYSCENGRNPKPTARHRGIPTSAHSAVSIDMIVSFTIYLRGRNLSREIYIVVEQWGKRSYTDIATQWISDYKKKLCLQSLVHISTCSTILGGPTRVSNPLWGDPFIHAINKIVGEAWGSIYCTPTEGVIKSFASLCDVTQLTMNQTTYPYHPYSKIFLEIIHFFLYDYNACYFFRNTKLSASTISAALNAHHHLNGNSHNNNVSSKVVFVLVLSVLCLFI